MVWAEWIEGAIAQNDAAWSNLPNDAPVIEDRMSQLKEFKPGDRIYVRAQQVWLVLVGFVMFSQKTNSPIKTMTYENFALAMGYGDPRMGYRLGRELGIVGACCTDNGLPTLNAIVVAKDTGLPGHQVLLPDGWTVRMAQEDVMKENWLRWRVPTIGTLRQVWNGTTRKLP